MRSVTIRSSRPLAAARVLAGRTSREAAALVPRLYSICARAQGAAAAAALDAAQGRRSVVAHAARELAVRLEALQEGLFRLLIDLPQAAGLAADVAPVAAARRAVAAALAALDAGDDARAVGRAAGTAPALAVFAAHVHGVPAGAWLALTDAAAIDRWVATSAVPPAAVLRALAGDARRTGPLRRRVAAGRRGARRWPTKLLPAMDADPAFAHAPHWQGAPAETGALARRRAHPGLAALVARDGATAAVRIVARLADLAALLVALDGDAGANGRAAAEPRWVDAIAPAPGEGFATVETARGLLVHRARVDGEIVTGYAIVAPTEWNFRPDGPLVRGARRPRCRRRRDARAPCAPRRARARPLRRLPRRGGPCMRWRWPRACWQIVEDTARAHAAARVNGVRLSIGALSHVEREALAFCFDVVTRGGVADGATLDHRGRRRRGLVHALRRDGGAGPLGDPCPRCGSFQLTVTQGDDMRVKDIEIA